MKPVNIIDLDLFPIPFSVINLGESSRAMNKEMLEMIFDHKEKYPISPKRSNIGGWQNTLNLEEI
jgi:hypothetical protein